MTGRLEFTVLGCGSSAGVPRADGAWGVCDPHEPRNRRSRCSLAVRRKALQNPGDDTTIVIDTSPDLRLQSANAGLKRLDAVLYTHDHADQTHGIDDIRAFFLKTQQRIPCWADGVTLAQLTYRFNYIFNAQGGYPAIADGHLIPPHGEPWAINGPSGEIPILTFDQDHGGVRSVGYRIGPVGYCSDVVALPEAALAALAGVEVFIIDALRYRPHPTHAHVALALDWIAALKPKRAILTNLHLDLDYATLAAELPEGVEPAYDGLRFEVEI